MAPGTIIDENLALSNGHTKDDSVSPTYTEDEQAVRCVRKLLIDIVRQNGGGHGGSAIGMAPLGVALWRHTMRYNPSNPAWFDRDRFVLSNGHAAMFLYTMLHLTGYPHMTLDELKMYANPKAVDSATGKWKSTICHGHPEIEVPGIEVTTGPLGQGVANAVGLAIASKQLAAKFNRADHVLIQSRIYCTTGDGCLQEGVAQEAMAIAGHLGLDNLVLCYDNNAVTCDGPLEWIVSEDTNAKVRALGWNVIDVFNGDASVTDIVAGLKLASSTKGRPTMVNIRTTIGYGTSTAGTFKSHHGTYSDDDAGLYAEPEDREPHRISQIGRTYLDATKDGKNTEDSWKSRLTRYTEKYPEDAQALHDRMRGVHDYKSVLDSIKVPQDILATRQFNGMVAGGADLWNSNQLGDQSSRIFDANNQTGQVIRYGIREHAMASISNGIAAYHPGSFIPITATFFMFYLYAAAGVRMGALSNLKVIHIATHDSIGEGQNGPTHQPVELDSLFRAMPNMLYIRPADAEEVVGAWDVALSSEGHSVMISLARDPAAIKMEATDRKKAAHGGYVVVENAEAVVTLISCGSELQFAVQAASELSASHKIATRVVSMPSIRLFEQQSEAYQDEVLGNAPHVISVEAYIATVWARFCTASIAMDSFGYSGGGAANFARFGLDTAGVVRKVKAHVQGSQSTKRSRWTLLQ
ncbi:hypothetical protein LTR78_010834 [Recurvomyces mirabilis]|uniref:Transketolase-like pyrimidine-binding domain-containing protein n=1 Tax=Recurvomyces mirabilis TaxID=574656 RepID=A0AAE0TP32_9PEZI|nr:hypothetical protein LTR78_010834 [Recurvomyces mirabilis]KAK5149492.1 hypothetical protein LTS14_010902 [Recurvomyces mirabilis]